MTSWLEDDKGNKSLMRLLALMGFILGAITVFSGLVAVWFALASATELVFAGVALAGAGEYAKVIQKKFEK